MKIRIDNGLVITMDPRRRIITQGTVVIQGNRILEVGKTAEVSTRHPADKVIDAQGKIVMPGLIDAHLHCVQTLARGLADDVDLIAWIYDRIYPYEALLTQEDTYVSTMLTCLMAIQTGTTCLADPGGYPMDGVAQALVDSGMRGIVSWAGMDQWSSDRALPDNLPGKKSTEDTLAAMEGLVKKWHGREGDRIRASYALRVEPNVTRQLFRRTKELADRDGVLIQMHAAVNRDQVEWVRRHTERTTIDYMNSLGVLGPNWLLTHMAILTDDELQMLRDNDVKLCHNPGASVHGAYGACSVGRFPELMDMGVTVTCGCDSTAANNSLDMFRTLYQLATLHKEIRVVPDLLSPEKALEMATVDAARALMWDKDIGSLEAGKKADVIIVDCHRPNWRPLHPFSIVPNLVYAGEGVDVETTIVDGRIVMEDRMVKTMNVPAILEQAQATAERLVARLPYTLAPRWPVE
ncbi:MAG: amidohydrolase [Chloroflexi bacterium]|nr:amidohydrolase [Chloroflexota bacterium]